jgi:hypothetical protein
MDNSVRKKYPSEDFTDAYYYIGCILHLDQDQAVPAHAFDIQHVVYSAWGAVHIGDDLEEYADDFYSHNSASPNAGIAEPSGFYKEMIDATKDAVNYNAVLPPDGQNWTEYWTDGDYGERRFPNNRDSEENGYVTQHDDMVKHRITEAISYTAGNLEVASKKLPPIVKNLEIYPTSEAIPEIDIQDGTPIEFKILENRTQTVKVYISIDSQPIIGDEYGTGKAFDLSTGSELPCRTESWGQVLQCCKNR